MKKIIAFLIAFVMIAGMVPTFAFAETSDSLERYCAVCTAVGDKDQNGILDPDDALCLLSCQLFPNRYNVLEHSGHTEGDCAECTKAGDMDQNGVFDQDDVMFLLYRTLFPNDFILPDCTCAGLLWVGYARVEITPEESMPIYGSTATSAHDPLQLTCTAVNDGKNTALLFSADLRNLSVDFTKVLTDLIKEKFGIPAEHVMINITHTHSAPNSPTSSASATSASGRWKKKLCDQLEIVVRAALDDLDEVDGIYVGTGHTSGVTFVRRYLMPDGSYDTNPSLGTATAHESEADTEMRTIRINRKNEKDIVMVNYQTHYGSATGLYEGQYSADFVHEFRERVEADQELDCHFVYHSGASANLNFNSAIRGERKYPDFIQAVKGINDKTQDANGGKGLIPTMKECLAAEKQVSLGKLRFASKWVEGPVYQDSAEDKVKALRIDSSGYDTSSAEYKALLAEAGFVSYRQVQGIVTRAGLGKSVDVPFYAITFGDIGFVSSPYEMFDTNGMQVREGSPFKMTFVCSYTNGGFGYVPSSLAFPHKCYEVYVSRFCETTGDDFAAEMVSLLKECKNK